MSNGNGVRIHEGLPHPLGATWDGLGVNFALFSAQRDQGRALPVRRGGRARDRAHRAARIHRRGLARLPARTRARAPSTATACTGRTSPRRGIASIRTSCCSTPMRKAHVGELKWEPERVRLHDRRARTTTCRSTSATARRSCRSAGSSIPPSPGRATSAPGDSVGAHDRLRDARARLHQAASARARGAARHRSRAWRAGRSSSTSSRLGVTAVELLPIHAFVDDSHLLERGLTQLLGLQHDRLLRARSALLRRRARRRASSRRWWRTCTTPASR